MFVCVVTVCAPALCGPSRGHGGALGGVYGRVAAACGFALVSFVGFARVGPRAGLHWCHRPGFRPRWAAGVTWTNRTTGAPWEARASHTSVIDAAGAIYVIGGEGGFDGLTFFQDVWASTDGGARAGLGCGFGGY